MEILKALVLTATLALAIGGCKQAGNGHDSTGKAAPAVEKKVRQSEDASALHQSRDERSGEQSGLLPSDVAPDMEPPGSMVIGDPDMIQEAPSTPPTSASGYVEILQKLAKEAVGFELVEESTLPADFDVCRYIPDPDRWQWFLYGTQSFNLSPGKPPAILGCAIDAYFVRLASTARYLLTQVERAPKGGSKLGLGTTEEFTRGSNKFERTGQPNILGSSTTLPLSPPELLIAGEEELYVTEGLHGVARKMVVKPLGLATVEVAGQEYADCLHMLSVGHETHDGKVHTSEKHTWWDASTGLVAKAFFACEGETCNLETESVFLLTTLLRQGRGQEEYDTAIRAGTHLPWSSDPPERVRHMLVVLSKGPGGAQLKQDHVRKTADSTRRMLFGLALNCENVKAELADTLSDQFRASLDEAQRMWTLVTPDSDPSGRPELGRTVIELKRQQQGALLGVMNLLDDDGLEVECHGALLDAAVRAMDNCLNHGEAMSPAWLKTAAWQECHLSPSTPYTSHCGSPEAKSSAQENPDWLDWSCRARPDTSSWPRCLGGSAYANEKGAGCPGKRKCCPPESGQPQQLPAKEAVRYDVPRRPIPETRICMDAFEVTNEAYDKCVGAGECSPIKWGACLHMQESLSRKEKYFGLSGRPGWSGSDNPVICVSPDDAQRYCRFVGGRLPSKDEWIKAARGESRNKFPWGDDLNDNKANGCDVNCMLPWGDEAYNDGFQRTAPVGSLPEGDSPLGISDMAGNVWEWVLKKGTPIAKGGAWNSKEADLRIETDYASVDSSTRWNSIGFRCAYDDLSMCTGTSQ